MTGSVPKKGHLACYCIEHEVSELNGRGVVVSSIIALKGKVVVVVSIQSLLPQWYYIPGK